LPHRTRAGERAPHCGAPPAPHAAAGRGHRGRRSARAWLLWGVSGAGADAEAAAMSDVSSDLGGIRAGPVERDIEQVRPANPSLGGSISPPHVPGSTAGATEMWMGR